MGISKDCIFSYFEFIDKANTNKDSVEISNLVSKFISTLNNTLNSNFKFILFEFKTYRDNSQAILGHLIGDYKDFDNLINFFLKNRKTEFCKYFKNLHLFSDRIKYLPILQGFCSSDINNIHDINKELFIKYLNGDELDVMINFIFKTLNIPKL